MRRLAPAHLEDAMDYIANAFALGMVPERCWVEIRPATRSCLDCGWGKSQPGKCGTCGDEGFVPDVPKEAVSAVGHEATAQIYSLLLGREVPCNRQAISLRKGDMLFVGSITGPDGRPWRLPEGTVLDQDALRGVRIGWRRVEVFTR